MTSTTPEEISPEEWRQIVWGGTSLPPPAASTLDVDEQAEFVSANRRAKQSQGPVPLTSPSHLVPGLDEPDDDVPFWAADSEEGRDGLDSEDEATQRGDLVRRTLSPVGGSRNDPRFPETVSTALASHRGPDNGDYSTTYIQRQVTRWETSQDHKTTSPSPSRLLADKTTNNAPAQSFAPSSTTVSASIQEGHIIGAGKRGQEITSNGTDSRGGSISQTPDNTEPRLTRGRRKRLGIPFSHP
jgi:hypothetical protein